MPEYYLAHTYTLHLLEPSCDSRTIVSESSIILLT